MKAYKVNLKSRRSYIVGKKSADRMSDKMEMGTGDEVVRLGGATFHVRDISTIEEIEIDATDAPEDVLEEWKGGLPSGKNWKNLPIETIVLDENYKYRPEWRTMSLAKLKRENHRLVIANAHWRASDAREKEYLLDRNQLKSATVWERDAEGYEILTRLEKYGIIQ